MQGLGMPQGSSECLDTGSANVVVRILFRQRPAGSLGVGSQGHRFGALGIKLLDHLGPDHPCRTHLGDLHEMVHPDCPEKGETGGKGIDVESGLDTGTDVIQPVGQGIGHLNIRGSTCFLHVISGDRNGVELRHLLGGEFEDVCNDLHREFRRIDVGIPYHKFLEDIILNRTGKLLQFGSLLERSDDVKGHNGQNGTVHGHRYRHFAERDLVEENLHVQDGVDGHSRLPHIAGYPGMVGVVSAVGSQVEGNRQALLTGCQIPPVKSIGLLGRRKTGILTDRPGLHHIHRGVGTP